MKNNKILIVGAGISGATIARLFADGGYDVTIIEKEEFVAGNCHDYIDKNGVLIHKFGPHIFHTNFKDVWEFVNKFSKFNNFKNKVLVSVDDKLIQMPINMNSIKSLFSKEEFKKFKKECSSINQESISIYDLMDKVTSDSSKKIVNYIYKNVYENYTSKMWGIPISNIDKDILKRVKINLNKNWNYFPDDKYQGLPVKGYTEMISSMLKHSNINVLLKTDFLKNIKIKNGKILYNNEEYITIFTGMIDKLFSFKYGELPYRSLNITFESYNKEWFQDVAVVNYPSDPKITRITEYKHMTKQKNKNWTTVSKEEPGNYSSNSAKFNRAFYPISNDNNHLLYEKYLNDSKKITNLFLLGRLATYKYIDMDDSIKNAFNLFDEIKKNYFSK